MVTGHMRCGQCNKRTKFEIYFHMRPCLKTKKEKENQESGVIPVLGKKKQEDL